MKKVLITGGLGYIGHSLVEILLANHSDLEITIFDNFYRKNLSLFFNPSITKGKVKLIEGDILDNRSIAKACKGIDSVIHLAAKTQSPRGEGEIQMYDYVNNWGTANVGQAARDANVKELLYLSSTSVYGDRDFALNIETQVDPVSDYAISKLAGERQVGALKDDMKVIIVRSSNTFGYNPSIRLDTVINNFMFKAHCGQIMLVNGSGDESRGFIHVERVAKQLSQLVLNSSYEQPIYQLSDYSFRINELVEVISEIYPNVQYRHVNPEKKMVNQICEDSALPDFLLQKKPDTFLNELKRFSMKFSF